jgi:hypothetical protein
MIRLFTELVFDKIALNMTVPKNPDIGGNPLKVLVYLPNPDKHAEEPGYC